MIQWKAVTVGADILIYVESNIPGIKPRLLRHTYCKKRKSTPSDQAVSIAADSPLSWIWY